MAKRKSAEEITIMREGGEILSRSLEAAARAVKPGVKLPELDLAATKAMRIAGGEPSFLQFSGHHDTDPFPSSLCASVNDEIVHGPALRDIELKDGDIIGLDLGCKYKGMYTDMAVTVPVGEITDEAEKLIEVTRDALHAGLDAVKPGNEIGDIGAAIEKFVAPTGFGIVRSLVGHGVGHAVHEDPRIPNFIDPSLPKIKMVEGMCLAIEPMITAGDYQITTLDDGWTCATMDGSLSAHFEVTVVVTADGFETLTPQPEL